MNTPIQGLAGEVLKLATRYYFDKIYDAKLDDKVKLCLTMHDELQSLVKDEYDESVQLDLTQWAHDKLQECMIQAGQQFLKVVPCVVETKISDCWSK